MRHAREGLHYDGRMHDDVELARSLPKVLLHEHLDGGLRVPTLFELLAECGLPAPATDSAGLADWFDARAHAGSLTEYLRGFALTVAAMASPAALERVAFEAAEDAREDGCVLAEFRIAPLLFEAHGLRNEVVVEALLAGLARSPLPTGLIVCAMRDLPVEQTLRAARLALAYYGQGVIGFDLAGAELGHPPREHRAALELCIDRGLPLSLHAGEADGAERVVEAVRLGARRIGHGVRLVDAIGDPARAELVDVVRQAGAHFEVCPTSNLHTGAVTSLARHPITTLWRAGVSLSFHTDNRLMSRLSHSSEALALLQQTPLEPADLYAMSCAALEHSFIAEAERAPARCALQAWGASRGFALPLPSDPL